MKTVGGTLLLVYVDLGGSVAFASEMLNHRNTVVS